VARISRRKNKQVGHRPTGTTSRWL